MSLARTQNLKYFEVDKRSKDLISQGFIYNQKHFSLSDYMQLNLANVVQLSNMSLVTFPIKFPTSDNRDIEICNNASQLKAFYAAAYVAVSTILFAGGSLKEQIRNSITEGDVEAVRDNR